MDDFAINPHESFIQNIIRLARKRGITLRRLEDVSGVDTSAIYPNRGRVRYPRLSREDAEALIILVLPEYPDLQKKLRHIKGYPEPDIDKALDEIVTRNITLESLSGAGFGELFHFNRERKMRNGTTLRVADCVISESTRATHGISTAALSQLERGVGSVPESLGFELLSKLGYSPDRQGLETFCHETAALLTLHERRQKEFGPALFIHMYPQNKVVKGIRDPHFKGQKVVCEAMHTSASNMIRIFNGEWVPREDQIQVAIKLFRYEGENAEDAFYNEARKRITDLRRPLEIPHGSPFSDTMATLGNDVRLLREELGIDQRVLGDYLFECKAQEDKIKSHAHVSYLESGKRKLPLSQELQSRLIEVLGMDSPQALHAMADQVEAVRKFREEHFIPALRECTLYAAEGRVNLTPADMREMLQNIQLSERELYQRANIALSPELETALREVNAYAENFNYSLFTPYTNLSLISNRVGRRIGR